MTVRADYILDVAQVEFDLLSWKCWNICFERILLHSVWSHWPTVLSVEPLVHGVVCLSSVCLSFVVCDILYCGETVRPSKKLSEAVNRKPGSKGWFFGSPPYFYFRFRCYGHRDGRFCLIFARTAEQLVLDGKNWLSSSKPCACCRIVW